MYGVKIVIVVGYWNNVRCNGVSCFFGGFVGDMICVLWIVIGIKVFVFCCFGDVVFWCIGFVKEY